MHSLDSIARDPTYDTVIFHGSFVDTYDLQWTLQRCETTSTCVAMHKPPRLDQPYYLA